jgi:hypothetical protein
MRGAARSRLLAPVLALIVVAGCERPQQRKIEVVSIDPDGVALGNGAVCWCMW